MDPSGPLLTHFPDGTINRRTGSASQGISRSRRENGRTPLSSYSFAPCLSIPQTACSSLHSTVNAGEFNGTEPSTASFRMQFSDTNLVPPKAERQKQNFGWVAHHSWAGPPGGEYPTANARSPLPSPCQNYLSPHAASQTGNPNSGDELKQFIQKHSIKPAYTSHSLTDHRAKEPHFK